MLFFVRSLACSLTRLICSCTTLLNDYSQSNILSKNWLFCQLDTLKYTVDRTAKDLDSARQKYNLLKKEVVNRTEKYVSYM